MNGKQIITKLKAAGWWVTRVRGSHHLMTNGSKTTPVPVHGNRDIGRGLIATIERQTGVKLT